MKSQRLIVLNNSTDAPPCVVSILWWAHLIGLSWLMSLFTAISGCDLLNFTMPVEVPIDVSKSGNVIETEFKISRDDRIVLYISFYFNDNRVERDRLLELLGNEIRPGIKIPLKIKVFKHESPHIDKTLLDKVYQSSASGGIRISSNNFTREIDQMNVSPGTYKIRLETMATLPQFAKTPVEFHIFYFHRKKA